MKKILSFLLAISLVISMIPMAFANTESIEMSGVKVVYNLTSFLGSNKATIESDGYKTINYTKTNGFYEFAAAKYSGYYSWNYGVGNLSHGNTIKPFASTASTKPMYIDSTFGLRMEVKRNLWFALKIYVPKKGTYTPKACYVQYGGLSNHETYLDYFLVKVTDDSVSEVLADSGLTTLHSGYIGSKRLDKADSGNVLYHTEAKAEAFDEAVTLEAGEYYLVYKPRIVANERCWAVAGTFILDGGTNTVPIISNLTATTNDGITTVTATAAKMSDNTNASDVTFTYAVADDDADKASVDANGVVTGKVNGKATIIATATKNGLSSSKSIEVDVTAPEDPTLKAAFDAVEDTTTITSYEVGAVSAVAYTVGTDAQDSTITVEAKDNEDGTYTLNAPEKDGYNFLYWKKGLTDKKDVITYKPTGFVYAPTAGENNYVIAVYEKVGEATTAKAEFYNANGQFIKATDGTFPTEIPSMAGYGDATGWECYTDGETYGLTGSVTPSGIMLFVADYEDTLDTVKVNGTDVPYGTEIPFTAAPEEGKVFKCWKRIDKVGNEEIVSIEKNYTFRAYEDCTIEEVDADSAVVLPANTRKIVLDTFSAGTATALMAEFIGFKNDTVVEKGIMFENKRIAMKSTGTQFTVIPDENGTYKGYAIIETDDGYTLITDGSYTK